MSLTKMALAISVVCGAALTVFIWMPLFAIGGLLGVASSLLSDGFHWYGRFYVDRNEGVQIINKDEEVIQLAEVNEPIKLDLDILRGQPTLVGA